MKARVGTYLFFWHDCQVNPRPNYDYPYPFGPAEDCNYRKFVYHPVSMTQPGLRYSSRNLAWYVDELQRMKRAGIDDVFPVYWGDHPTKAWFDTRAVALLAQAIGLLGSDIKIGMFDDTTSQVAQWNWDLGRLFQPTPAMNLGDIRLWTYFSDKIARFYRVVPRSIWATHNGLPVEEGGRPLIIVWVASSTIQDGTRPSFFSLEVAPELWKTVKERFQQEFGVEPFLVLESSWFHEAPALKESTAADAQYNWGAAAFHSIWEEKNGYIVSAVGPGYDDRLLRGTTTGRHRRRNLVHNARGEQSLDPDPAAFFKNEYLLTEPLANWPHHGVHPDSDLILVETWNELYEGSGIADMSDWLQFSPTQPVRPDTYIEALRQLKRQRPGFRDHDFTIVSARSDGTGRLWSLELRNDGELTWKPGETRLGYRIHSLGGSVLKEGILSEIPGNIGFGETVLVTFSQPAPWTDPAAYPSSNLAIYMKTGDTWFSAKGDTPLVRPVKAEFPGFF